MRVRRILAAAVTAVAFIAVNVGTAETASAKGVSWGLDDRDQKVQTSGVSWG